VRTKGISSGEELDVSLVTDRADHRGERSHDWKGKPSLGKNKIQYDRRGDYGTSKCRGRGRREGGGGQSTLFEVMERKGVRSGDTSLQKGDGVGGKKWVRTTPNDDYLEKQKDRRASRKGREENKGDSAGWVERAAKAWGERGDRAHPKKTDENG